MGKSTMLFPEDNTDDEAKTISTRRSIKLKYAFPNGAKAYNEVQVEEQNDENAAEE